MKKKSWKKRLKREKMSKKRGINIGKKRENKRGQKSEKEMTKGEKQE